TDPRTLCRGRIQWRRQSARSRSSSRSWLHRRHQRREGVELVKLVVDVSPEGVDAGPELTLDADPSQAPASGIRGPKLVIKDHAGADVGSMELTEAVEFVVKAPATPGTYTWSAVYGETSTPISFTVKPHTTSVVVWDIPSAIAAGETFRAKI